MSDFKSATVRYCDQQNRAPTAAEIAIIKGEWIQWAESEIAALRQKLEQAEARAEMRREALYDCAVALKDAGSLSKEMHDLIVKANESGGDAWLLRKEADDVDSSVEWLHVNYHHLDGHHLGILTARANRLRQQASEIESGDNNE